MAASRGSPSKAASCRRTPHFAAHTHEWRDNRTTPARPPPFRDHFAMPQPLPLLLRIVVRLLPACMLCTAFAQSQAYTSYDLVIPVTPPSEPLVIDGREHTLPRDRSFVIGIDGGLRGGLVFTHWAAPDAEHPVIIVNRHGTGRVVIKDDGVNFRDGIRFEHCAFVKLLGNNDPAFTHGIEVAQAGRVPAPGVSRVSRIGVNVATLCTNIEIGWVEIHHTG